MTVSASPLLSPKAQTAEPRSPLWNVPPWARPNGSRLAHEPEVAAWIEELRGEFRKSAALSVEYLQALLLPVAERMRGWFPRFLPISISTRAVKRSIRRSLSRHRPSAVGTPLGRFARCRGKPRAEGIAAMPEREAIAQLVLNAPAGRVSVLAGVSLDQVRLYLQGAEALSTAVSPFSRSWRDRAPMRSLLERSNALAQIALTLWPRWFSDIDFSAFGRDALGHEAARLLARAAAEQIEGMIQPWAEAAVAQALERRLPRVSGTPTETEFRQLCLTIDRNGLVLVTPGPIATEASAFVHAIEWIAGVVDVPVVVVFDALPDHGPPLDRILYGARIVAPERTLVSPATSPSEGAETWLAPIAGRPHPLSEIEQRLAKVLAGDGELAPVFCFNQTSETIRGSRPRVDLIWTEGRLVVERDGYESHGNRAAFMYDRHRDYELTLSGYTVLRLANDEVAQDIEKSIEKIRDLVRMRQAPSIPEE